MQPQLINNPVNAKYMALNNFTSCTYVALIVLWLYLTDSLFEVGHFKSTYLQWILLVAEFGKYIVFTRYSTKDPKKLDSKKFRAQNIFKGAFTMLVLVASFHTVAVLFGAPFFSKQQETFTFALTMAILTVLPCCLHLGANRSVSLLLSLTSRNSNDLQGKFLTVTQLTCFAAWLGAVVIPLDWNRPFQVWPIPCILGALSGFFLGNLVLGVSYLLQKKSKKNIKVEC